MADTTRNEQFFIDLSKGASWAAGVAFQRSNPLPLDKYSVFETEAKAIEYATTSAVAYPGQVIAYVDGDKMAVCVLAQTADGTSLELQSIGGAIGDYETAAADTLPQKKAIYDEAGENVIGYEVKWVPISAIVEGDGNTTYAFAKKADDEKTLVFTPYDEGVAGEATEITLNFLTPEEINALIEAAKKYADDNDANTTYTISYGEYEVSEGITKKAIRLLGSDNNASYVDVADFLKDSVLEGVSYNADTNTLTFTWNTLDEEGNKVTTDVELTDMLSPYTAGNGINITEQTISVKVKENDKYIEVTTDGIASKGIDDAIAQAIEDADLDQYTTEEEVKDIAYTKEEVYTKSEADKKIEDALKAATGGESASDVLIALNNFKAAVKTEVWGSEVADDALTGTTSRLDATETKANSAVQDVQKTSTDTKLVFTKGEDNIVKVDDSALVALIAAADEKATNAGAAANTNGTAIENINNSITGINENLTNNYVSNTSLNNTLASYLTSEQVSGTYLTKTDAGNTYLTKSDASTTYLSKETAEATYATKASVETLNGTVTNLAETVGNKADASALNNYYNKTEIGDLGDKTVVTLISEAQAAAEGKVTELADGAVKTNTDNLATLIGNDTGKSVRTIAADEINTLIGGVSSEDTIENITSLITYVNANGASVIAMQEDIEANTSAIAALQTSLTDYKVKSVDDITLTVSDAGVASVKAISTDLLIQGSEELIFNAGNAGTVSAN